MLTFEEVKNIVVETAKNTMQKSSEMIEATKINMSILDVQSKASKLFEEVGKIVYEAYQEGEMLSQEITSKFTQVDEMMEQIKDMKERLSRLKKVKICANCQSENQISAIFCSKCGEKIIND